jgi:hypothetical protein
MVSAALGCYEFDPHRPNVVSRKFQKKVPKNSHKIAFDGSEIWLRFWWFLSNHFVSLVLIYHPLHFLAFNFFNFLVLGLDLGKNSLCTEGTASRKIWNRYNRLPPTVTTGPKTSSITAACYRPTPPGTTARFCHSPALPPAPTGATAPPRARNTPAAAGPSKAVPPAQQ